MRAAVAAVLALAGAGCDSAGTQVLPDVHTSPAEAADPRFADVLGYMQRQMATGGVPGGAIAIVVNGKLAFEAGVGVERAGERTPVSSTTLFRAASLSKPVLAVAALKLAETGALDLTLPITTYLPSYRLAPAFDASTLTGQELLDHTAGLPDVDVAHSCPVGPGALEHWFLTAGRSNLWTPPGEVWNYSNEGYALAGWMIESAAGMPYEDAVARLVFGPAGMTTATFEPEVAMAEDHADGHAVVRGKLTAAPLDVYDCEVTRPPAGVIASVVDYAHFAEMLLAAGAGTLQPSSVLAMETGRVDTGALPGGGARYGDGLVVYGDYGGQKVVSHAGLLDYGYQSSIWLVPAQGFAVVVFYDAVGPLPDNVSQHAIDTFLEGGDASAPDASTPPSTWQPYAGDYFDPFTLGAISVDFDGRQLLLSVPSLGVAGEPLVQQGGATFVGPSTPFVQVATFYPGPCGPSQWFVTRVGVGSRVPACDAGLDAP